MAIAEVIRVKVRGYYSIRYMVDDLINYGLEFAMDYNSRTGWTCSDTEVGTIHWMTRRTIPEHSLQPMLDHFGLTREDFGTLLFCIYDASPAVLVRTRRAKERREGLDRKEIKNMRLGCHYDELLPEAFEAVA